MNAPDLVALQAIADAIRAGWPDAIANDVRRASLAVVYQTGHIHAERVAIGVRVIEAVATGVRAGAWPDADELIVAIDLILSGLDFALADVSGIELALLLRNLATGRGCAAWVEVLP